MLKLLLLPPGSTLSQTGLVILAAVAFVVLVLAVLQLIALRTQGRPRMDQIAR